MSIDPSPTPDAVPVRDWETKDATAYDQAKRILYAADDLCVFVEALATGIYRSPIAWAGVPAQSGRDVRLNGDEDRVKVKRALIERIAAARTALSDLERYVGGRPPRRSVQTP